MPAIRRWRRWWLRRLAVLRRKVRAARARFQTVLSPRLAGVSQLLGQLPRRTLVAGAAALSALVVVVVLGGVVWSSPSSTAPHWMARIGGEPAGSPDAPPSAAPTVDSEPRETFRYQPPRARAVPVQPSPVPPPPPPPTRPGNGGEEDDDGDFVTWAVMDLRSGAITGSDTLAETSTTASMIKAWLVADYLRRATQAGDEPSPERLDKLTLIIRDSNNEYAQELFEELGYEQSIHRLINICGLTDSRAVPRYWSNTRLSGRDTARMGACLADGRAAGPDWTEWLLDEMRQVRGVGDFGIRHALPADQRPAVAIKNGWVVRSDSGEYHVNCLAIGDGWSMGVLTRYPAHLGYLHGAEICRSLAADHLPLP